MQKVSTTPVEHQYEASHLFDISGRLQPFIGQKMGAPPLNGELNRSNTAETSYSMPHPFQ